MSYRWTLAAFASRAARQVRKYRRKLGITWDNDSPYYCSFSDEMRTCPLSCWQKSDHPTCLPLDGKRTVP